MCKYKIISVQTLSAEQQGDLWDLLVLADNEFIPPLSDRDSTTQKNLVRPEVHNEKLPTVYYEALLEQHFLLVLDDERVIGFMSYIPNHEIVLEDGKRIIAEYISTVIVHPEYRSNGITEKLYRFMIEQKKSGNIATRTWSTNHAHLRILSKMGFENVSRIVNDRGEGIDTVYYCKTI